MGKVQLLFSIRVSILGTGLYTPPNFFRAALPLPSMKTIQSLHCMLVNKGMVKITQNTPILPLSALSVVKSASASTSPSSSRPAIRYHNFNRMKLNLFNENYEEPIEEHVTNNFGIRWFEEITQLRAHLFLEKVIILGYCEQYRRNCSHKTPLMRIKNFRPKWFDLKKRKILSVGYMQLLV